MLSLSDICEEEEEEEEEDDDDDDVHENESNDMIKSRRLYRRRTQTPDRGKQQKQDGGTEEEITRLLIGHDRSFYPSGDTCGGGDGIGLNLTQLSHHSRSSSGNHNHNDITSCNSRSSGDSSNICGDVGGGGGVKNVCHCQSHRHALGELHSNGSATTQLRNNKTRTNNSVNGSDTISSSKKIDNCVSSSLIDDEKLIRSDFPHTKSSSSSSSGSCSGKHKHKTKRRPDHSNSNNRRSQCSPPTSPVSSMSSSQTVGNKSLFPDSFKQGLAKNSSSQPSPSSSSSPSSPCQNNDDFGTCSVTTTTTSIIRIPIATTTTTTPPGRNVNNSNQICDSDETDREHALNTTIVDASRDDSRVPITLETNNERTTCWTSICVLMDERAGGEEVRTERGDIGGEGRGDRGGEGRGGGIRVPCPQRPQASQHHHVDTQEESSTKTNVHQSSFRPSTGGRTTTTSKSCPYPYTSVEISSPATTPSDGLSQSSSSSFSTNQQHGGTPPDDDDVTHRPPSSSYNSRSSSKYQTLIPLHEVKRNLTRKQIIQLSAMTGIGFVFVAFIILWLISPVLF